MKIKILVTAITLVILAILSAAIFFIYKIISKPEIQQEKSPAAAGEVSSSTDSAESPNSPADEKEVLEETRLLKNDFELILPPGWQEATSSLEEILAIGIDAQEDIADGKFQKFNFRTNFTIKSDDLSKYSSADTLDKYVESVKTSLMQTIPSIKLIKEEQKTINGSQAILIECSSSQEGVGFKTLLVFVKGKDNILYAISFNTFQSSWAKYQSVFEQIAQSFKLRYGI